jgi:hypothetical protein
MKAFCAIVLTAALASAAPEQPSRGAKAIALFNVVTFPNVECQSTKDTTNKGTCFSSTECSDKGGTAEGNCASGFGVCCIVRVTAEAGGDVKINNTIIENHNYPTAYTTASKTATYKVTPLSNDICFLRYDFIKMDLGITATTGLCSDKFEVDIPSAVGTDPSAICGLNDGQHMYSDVARSKEATSVKIVTSTSTTYSRKWKIKISQIGCDCPVKPERGCSQYYTASCGTVQSLNFAATTQLMPHADLMICVRQNSGMCGTTWVEEANPGTKDAFGLATTKSICTAGTSATSGCLLTSVVHDAITSPQVAGNEACDHARIVFGTLGAAYCGGHLNSVTKISHAGSIITKDFSFRVTMVSTSTLAHSTGYKLNYKQTGCQ